MSRYPTYDPQRAIIPEPGYKDYRREPGGYYSTYSVKSTPFYQTPPLIMENNMFQPTYAIPVQSSRDPSQWRAFAVPDTQPNWRLPNPEKGSKPPHEWDEWETNRNWPFPVNQAKPSERAAEPSRLPTSTPNKNSKAIMDEYEANKNWPFPANQPRPSSRNTAATPKPNLAARTEFEHNSNWPFPPTTHQNTSSQPALAPRPRKFTYNPPEDRSQVPAQRPRQSSFNQPAQHSATPVPPPRNASRGRPEENVGGHATHLRQRSGSRPEEWTERLAPRPRTLSGRTAENPGSNVNRMQPEATPRESARVAIQTTVDPSHGQIRHASSTPEMHPMLARRSSSLIRYDLRGSMVNVRKLIKGQHWTPLKADDHIIIACKPPRSHMRLYVREPGCEEWVIDVVPRPHINSGLEYVTIGDVLNAISIKYNKPVDNKKWARDSVNPKLAELITRAHKHRLETIDSRRSDESKRGGILRCDYLGSKYCFGGIQYEAGSDGSDWFRIILEREQRK